MAAAKYDNGGQSPSMPSSLSAWMSELRWMAELESMSILQGKPLCPTSVQDSTTCQVQAYRDAIDRVKSESNKISDGFNRLFKLFDKSQWSNMNAETTRIVCQIRRLIHLSNSHVVHVPQFIQEQQELVMCESAKLLQQTASTLSKDVVAKVPLVNQMTYLGQAFSTLVDSMLTYLVRHIVKMLDQCISLPSINTVINNIITLALDGEHSCYMLAREGCVRVLTDICRREGAAFTRSKALRALATVCCAPECIAELHKHQGLDLLLDILSDSSVPESVAGEAAGVVAQVTSPVLDHNSQLSLLAPCLSLALTSLLDLCGCTSGLETFLLSSAALANLTFLDASVCVGLMDLGAAYRLVKAARQHKARSPFAKDQVATIFANMAAVPVCRDSLRDCGAMELMVNFLYQTPQPASSQPEKSACDRVQQKGAIALMRLCQDMRVTHHVVRQRVTTRKMASSTLLLLMVMTACVTVHAVSYTEKLESWNYAYYARNWAHLGSVTDLELLKVHTASPPPDCRANATFGFYGSTTWVSKGCRGDFRVSIDDTDTMEQKFDQLTEDVNNDAAKTVNLTAEVEAQNKVIAETRCAVALLNEDDPMHDCCCPHGWTLHQFDGDRICYRFEEHNIKRLTKTGGAEELCEALHPNATLPMPKTKAQIQVLKSFVSDYDYELEHIAIDRDETGDYKWQDGSAVDPTVIYPKNFAQYGQPCGDTTEIVWSVMYDIMICEIEDNYHIDRAQLCQIALTECPLNEE